MKIDRDRKAVPRLSVVMPAYNEAPSLAATLAGLKLVLEQLGLPWEVIVVDDGSRDETLAALQAWLDQPGFRCLALSRNFGKEAALTAGIDHARGDLVLLMDADGQHPATLIPLLVQDWRAGADMVCAVRADRGDESFLKRLGTRWFYRLANAGSPVRIPADAGDFRLMDRRVVDALKALPERNRFMKGLYAWVGFDVRLRPYAPGSRIHGRSTYSLARLSRLGITGITAFSNLPLRIWSAAGVFMAFAAMLYGVWIAFEHFVEGHPVPGWATLVTGLMFFGGVQLLSVGILGEYVGRIFEEVKQRPVYVVARVLGGRRSLASPGPAETRGAPSSVMEQGVA